MVLESTLCRTFPPPPQIHAIRFAPLSRCPILRTPGHTLSGLWGSRPGGLFRDSFRTLPGFGPEGPRETLCRAGPILIIVFQLIRTRVTARLLQSPGPPAEPRNPGTPKVHFKVRKMPFSTPRKKGPKSQLKCPKSPFWGIKKF